MKFKHIGIILMISVSVIALGCVGSQTSEPKSIENPNVLITVNLSQILPTINDMPDGSKKLGDEMISETYAVRNFGLQGVLGTQGLKYEAYKFSSINESMDKYNSLKNEKSDYKLTVVNLGNEGYGLEEANSIASVVFRKANIVVKVVMIAPYITTLSETISYAEKVRV